MRGAHSPVPWTFPDIDPSAKSLRIKEPGISIDYDDVDQAVAVANLRLAYAGPDMLKALFKILWASRKGAAPGEARKPSPAETEALIEVDNAIELAMTGPWNLYVREERDDR